MHLDQVFVAVQAYSYLGDYLDNAPSIERIAETLDKFEEDWLDKQYASVRAKRRAEIMVGKPIPVSQYSDMNTKEGYHALTFDLETNVQKMLNKLCSNKK